MPDPISAGRGFLTVIGAINWDVSIFEERFARPGEEVPVREVEEFPGGKGANTAVAAARVLGPGRVALVGALGDDAIASRQLSALREEGVVTDGVSILKGHNSGRAYILIDWDGRKTIHTHFGANGELLPKHLSTKGAVRAMSNSSMTVVMDPPSEVALHAAKSARAGGSSLIYSPGVRTLEGLRGIGEIIRLADALILDSNELKNLCQTVDEEAGIALLRRRFPGLTIVATLGPKGCAVADSGDMRRIEGVDLETLGLRAVNSAGSGDAFLGVFASYLLRGTSMFEAVAWANLAGAIKATRHETRGSPRAEELESHMKSLEKVKRSRRGSPKSTTS